VLAQKNSWDVLLTVISLHAKSAVTISRISRLMLRL